MPIQYKTLNRLHAQKPLSQHAQKMRSWCLPVEPWAPNRNRELQNVNRVLQIWTVSSNSQPWAPIINHELQCWTSSSTGATPKFTKTSKLHRTVQNESRQCPNRLFIFYYILYVFYFYYILFYIICILFLLYVILYYINFHNIIFSLGIVFLT